MRASAALFQRVTAVELAQPSIVRVAFDCPNGPEVAFYPSPFLWAYAPSNRDPMTTQRLITAVEASQPPAIDCLDVDAEGVRVVIRYRGLDKSFVFSSSWLYKHRPTGSALAEAALLARPCALIGAPTSLGWASLQSDVSPLLLNLEADGIALVTGCPVEDASVLRLASLVAPPMETLYGRSWVVREEPRAINIAYTSLPLELHQDLPYVESPPGLQFLLCKRPADTGGASTFLDAFAAAEELHARDPLSFATLARIPTTWEKIHAARDHPVHMQFSRPIFTSDARGELVEVRWAPPFEGALRGVCETDITAHARAYAAFARVLADLAPTRGLEFVLRRGDAVVFNNRRLLHGRTGFEGGARELAGCYVSVDEWRSRLARLIAPRAPQRIGNGDFGF